MFGGNDGFSGGAVHVGISNEMRCWLSGVDVVGGDSANMMFGSVVGRI